MSPRSSFVTFALLALVGWGTSVPGWAAETATPVPMSKTRIILKLDASRPLTFRSRFTDHPPTISIEFPRQQVVGSLPERAVVAQGLIQAITARYDEGPTQQRFLRDIQIVLNAPYAHRVRSEPGRIIVEVDHPASISSTAVDVGVRGGTVISGLTPLPVSERFHAMQEALARATPTPWSFEITQAQGASRIDLAALTAGSSASQVSVARPPPRQTIVPPSHGPAIPRNLTSVALAFFIIGWGGLGLAGSLAVMRYAKRRQAGRPIPETPSISSGMQLLDQLVWRAFERQQYELVAETELPKPLGGTLRVIVKDGVKAALLLVGHASFFEKRTVQQFLHAMRSIHVEQGFLVAPSSFTVPAQRFANEHGVSLIGREQLAELLSLGAKSEAITRQIDEQRSRLAEIEETVHQYAREMDTLRRQRNEASWFLGESRAAAATLEAKLEEMTQQVRRQEAELNAREQDALGLRKQWEESQWYLGEAQARGRHLEEQLSALQDVTARLEVAERERHEANWFLGEERGRCETWEARFADLQRHLETSAKREAALQASLEQVKRELAALRTYGERRNRQRVQIPNAFIELHDGKDQPVFSGSLRDVSSSGVGLETDRALPVLSSARLRLTIPGCEPIETKAHLMWQRDLEADPPRFHSGCHLVGLSASTRALIEQLIKSPGG